MLVRLSLVLSALAVGSFASPPLDIILSRSEVALAPFTVDDGVSLQWSGSIFPGEEPTVLYGDIEEIYKAILSVNPDYQAAEASPESWETFGVDTGTSLEKRQNGYSCAVMATGDYFDLHNARNYLRSIGGNCGAPGRECRRTTCQDTSGTYFCSEFDGGASVPCSVIGDIVDDIVRVCCSGGESGHFYPQGRAYSVWAGYANCGHSPNTRPSTYTYPGGSPNGLC